MTPLATGDRTTALVEDVRRWLAEDIGSGDVTSEAIVAEGMRCRAEIQLKQPGVVCGLDLAEDVFRELDATMRFESLRSEGEWLAPCRLALVEGDARAILAGERLALNLLGRLSAIATLTRRYADAVAGTGVTILDTRKTTPGLRSLEKHAVVVGGGRNHRRGLYDAVLIKDTHRRIAGSVSEALRRVEGASVPVEVECETRAHVEEALAAGATAILVDNMALPEIAAMVQLVAGRATVEASGGVTLETVAAVAATGVDYISVGALTHSVPTLDVSLEVLT